jgi:excisionase family DNA binding protein
MPSRKAIAAVQDIDVSPRPSGRLAFSIPEFAAALGISRSTVYEEIADKRLSIVKIGRASRITAAEADRYVTALQAESAASRKA